MPTLEMEKVEEKHRQAVADYFSTKTEFWDIVYAPNKKSNGNSLVQQDDMNFRKDTALKLIEKYSNNKKLKILDVGCGSGNLLESIWEMGHEADGIDISDKMVETVNEKIKSKKINSICLQAPAESIPYADNTFDLVTCLGVIEYLYRPELGVKELNRIIKPDGILIMSIPNLIRLKYLLDPYYYLVRGTSFLKSKLFKKKYRQIDHLIDLSTNENFSNRRFIISKFLDLAEEHGFEKLYVENIGYGPFTFFKKYLLNDKNTLKLSRGLNRLSKRKGLRFIKHLSNRWVICLKKKG